MKRYPPLYSKEEIREGCKECPHCLEDSRERGEPWCMFGKRPYSNPIKGTNNCVFWGKKVKEVEVKLDNAAKLVVR